MALLLPMKKILSIFLLTFSLGLFTLSTIALANQSGLDNYYPSPSGTYTKVQIINGATGPSAASFCAQTSGGTDTPGSGATFINAGTVFSDASTGFLEICRPDGSVASYPGSCFSRFGNSAPNASSCPTNYQPVNITNNASFTLATGGNQVYSWSCCFTGQGDAALATPLNPAGATLSKSGCFSLFSSSINSIPALCNTVDPNAYDVSCDSINSTDTTPVFKRNCCFNSFGSGSLTVTSTCKCSTNTCAGYQCGTDPCNNTCGTNGGGCAPGFYCNVTNGKLGNCIPNPNPVTDTTTSTSTFTDTGSLTSTSTNTNSATNTNTNTDTGTITSPPVTEPPPSTGTQTNTTDTGSTTGTSTSTNTNPVTDTNSVTGTGTSTSTGTNTCGTSSCPPGN